jgi:hypothetical protein
MKAIRGNILIETSLDPRWRALASAVVIQAVKDAKCEDPSRALDAVLFLTGSDIPLWLEGCGLPDLDPVQLVTSGRARSIRVVRGGT